MGTSRPHKIQTNIDLVGQPKLSISSQYPRYQHPSLSTMGNIPRYPTDHFQIPKLTTNYQYQGSSDISSIPSLTYHNQSLGLHFATHSLANREVPIPQLITIFQIPKLIYHNQSVGSQLSPIPQLSYHTNPGISDISSTSRCTDLSPYPQLAIITISQLSVGTNTQAQNIIATSQLTVLFTIHKLTNGD